MFIFFNHWPKLLNIDFENTGKNSLTSPIPEEDPVMMTTFPLTLSDSLLFLMKPKRLNNIEIGMNTTRSENVTIGRKMLRILLIKAISLLDLVYLLVQERAVILLYTSRVCHSLGIIIKDLRGENEKESPNRSLASFT